MNEHGSSPRDAGPSGALPGNLPSPLAFRPLPALPLGGPGELRKLASPYGLTPPLESFYLAPEAPAFVAPAFVAPAAPSEEVEPPPLVAAFSAERPRVAPAPAVQAPFVPVESTLAMTPDAEEVAPPAMLGPIAPKPPEAEVAPPPMLNAAPPPTPSQPELPPPSTPWAQAPRVDASQLPSAALRPVVLREEPEAPKVAPKPLPLPEERSSRAPIIALVVLLGLLAVALVVIVVRKKSGPNDPIAIALANGSSDDPSAEPSATAAPSASATAKPKLFGTRPKGDEDPYDQAEREMRAKEKKPGAGPTASPTSAPEVAPTAAPAAKDRLGI